MSAGNDPASRERVLNALVDAMAKYLAQGLNLKDPSMSSSSSLNWKRNANELRALAASAPNLAITLFKDLRYLPSKRQLDFLADLYELQALARRAEQLATALEVRCHYREEEGALAAATPLREVAVSVAEFVHLWGYYQDAIVEEHNILIGGVGGMLKRSVYDHVFAWLCKCDRKMCNVHNEDTSPARDRLEALISAFAIAIAKRITMHAKPASKEMLDEVDYLSPLFLQGSMNSEYERARVEADCAIRNDMKALRALMVVARDGGSTPEATHVLCNQINFLRRAITTPAEELGLVGENAKRMNMGMLTRVLDTTVALDARASIASLWSNRHGAHAQTSIAEAMQRLSSFSLGSRFQPVVKPGRGGFGQVEVPEFPVQPWAGAWHFVRPREPCTRTGLPPGIARRVVRMTSMIWQMIGDGALFEEGKIAADVVAPIAIVATHNARYVYQVVEWERRRCNFGIELHSFRESIDDPSSDMAEDLDRNQCALSLFSYRDIATAFDPRLPLLEHVIEQLSERTRAELGNRRTPIISADYTTFARDALALLLPAVFHRRLAAGVGLAHAPHPLSDLLRTSPAIRKWAPKDGPARIDYADLKHAHPRLRAELEHLAQTPNPFVMGAHAKASHKRMAFVLHPAYLLRFLDGTIGAA